MSRKPSPSFMFRFFWVDALASRFPRRGETLLSLCLKHRSISTSADVCVKNHALFFLTIALLELTYGAPLTTHKTPADLDDAYTPYRIAERLTRQIQDDELPKFASVVGKCMYPTPESTDFSLQNEAVRKRFWSEVILPLREDWEELVTDPQHVFQDISG
ncbi:hypothetical protein UCDDS831_g00029 [Diplodia seriata]|uniref:Uncharacterized protein n=1 Tax=Diplodia seriata TaxID=420778 RepID=A0A0G2F3V3_9PEZI|nr:hypothetical protein UCDDS831_g00029 [Diplodia seriata]